MKKLLGFLVFFGIIGVLVYYYLNYKAEKKDEGIVIDLRKKELEEMRKKEQEQDRALSQQERLQQQKVLEDRKKRQDFLSDRRGTTPLVIPTPLPTRDLQPVFKYKSTVDAACKEARCTLVKYEETGDSSFIVVQGPDNNTVSSVLDPLVRAGMKDFTEHKDQFKVQMDQGRRIYTAAYTIKW